METDLWPVLEACFTRAFANRSRADWTAVFDGADACVSPVVAPDEVRSDPQMAHRLMGAPGTVPPISRAMVQTIPPLPWQTFALTFSQWGVGGAY